MRDTSFLVSPIRDHAFFEQPELERRLGNDLLHSARLPAQPLHLVTGSSPCRVTRKAAFASLQELLRPHVIQTLGDPLTAAQLGDAVLPAQAVQHDADLVLGGIMLARGAADVVHDPLGWGFMGQGFCSHLRSFVTTMRPKPSVVQYR